jgi:hypothetical protein
MGLEETVLVADIRQREEDLYAEWVRYRDGLRDSLDRGRSLASKLAWTALESLSAASMGMK